MGKVESGGDSWIWGMELFLCIRSAEAKFIACDVSWSHMFISSGVSASHPLHGPHGLALYVKTLCLETEFCQQKKGRKVSIWRCLLSFWFGWLLPLQHAELLLFWTRFFSLLLSHVIVPLWIQSVQQAVGVVRLTDLHIKVKPFMLCLDWWRDGGKDKIPLVWGHLCLPTQWPDKHGEDFFYGTVWNWCSG